MRRILMLVTLVAVAVVIMAVGAAPAMADNFKFGKGQQPAASGQIEGGHDTEPGAYVTHWGPLGEELFGEDLTGVSVTHSGKKGFAS